MARGKKPENFGGNEERISAVEKDPQGVESVAENMVEEGAGTREALVVAQEVKDKGEMERVREKIGDQQIQKRDTPRFSAEACGDFSGQLDINGKILPTAEQQRVFQEAIKDAKKADRFTVPHLAIGGKTATEYESRARNFSTETKIVVLQDGRKAFLIHNYPLSWIHREMDALGKWTAGAKMRKQKSADWKAAVEAKSNIPTIENADPDTVLMPFIDNVNANDLFAFNHEIKDFGAFPEGEEYGLEDKLAMAEKIVDALSKIHEQGEAWGESILANVIITKDGNPIIVDPEVEYDDDVPMVERQARDLRDLVQSTVSALRRSEKEIDIPQIVARLVSKHPDPAVRAEIVKNSKEKISWVRKLILPIHEFPRLGAKRKDYNATLEAIRALE